MVGILKEQGHISDLKIVFIAGMLDIWELLL